MYEKLAPRDHAARAGIGEGFERFERMPEAGRGTVGT
jgi:hypothetical protein